MIEDRNPPPVIPIRSGDSPLERIAQALERIANSFNRPDQPAPIQPPQETPRCEKCRGTGIIFHFVDNGGGTVVQDGKFCTCPLGHDLARLNERQIPKIGEEL